MIRVTAGILRRSGAQFLIGEQWIAPGDNDGLAAAVASLAGSALERYSADIGKAGGELVVRVADRAFECIDPPTDRVAPPAAAPPPRPKVATREGKPAGRLF